MSYTLTGNPAGNPYTYIVIRDRDGTFIPDDPDNRDYWEYRDWLVAGNQPKPAAPIQAAPTVEGLAVQVAEQEQRISALETEMERLKAAANQPAPHSH